ncbi:peptidase C13 family protein, partial [Acinetobacter baumannii]
LAPGVEPTEPQWTIANNMELKLPQMEKYLCPQPNTGSVNIAQTQTEAKNDATPAKKQLL